MRRALAWLTALLGALLTSQLFRPTRRPTAPPPAPRAPAQREDEPPLPPRALPLRSPVLWPAALVGLLGLLLVLLGAVTHWLLIVLGALLLIGALLAGVGEVERARRAGELIHQGPHEGRRRGLALLGLGAGAAAVSAVAYPVLGLLVRPVERREEPEWRTVGPVDQFEQGTTTLVDLRTAEAVPWGGRASETAVYLRRNAPGEFVTIEEEFAAFSIYCTHLGCPVRWEDGPRMFFCPCHGGVFDPVGRAIAGPPVEPLARHPTRVVNGTLQIRTLPVPLP